LEETSKVLVVRSESEFYALDLRAVQEIVYRPDITSLPQVTGPMTGLCLWRQKQVPVIDLGLYLGGSKAANSGDLVMAAISGWEQGILVDEIGPVMDLPVNSLISVDKNFNREQVQIAKAFELEDKIIYILETQALISHLAQ
jgi:chemotaxis signal transduction protein